MGSEMCIRDRLFVALQKITHMKLVHMDGTSRFFTEEERNILLEMLSSKKEIKYAAVRKKLNLPLEEKFNTLNYNMKRKGKDNKEEEIDEAAIIAATEKATFVSMSNCYEYRKRIGDYLDTLPEEEQQDLLDEIGTILTCYKNDDSRMSRLTEAGLSKELADSLLELTPAKFQHLSIKAMKKIMPYMKEGMVYDKACEAAGYDFKNDNHGKKMKLLKGENITETINEITNPVVKRSVSQTVKVINAIILKYGSPQAVSIELAREMSKNLEERRKAEKQMEEKQKLFEVEKEKELYESKVSFFTEIAHEVRTPLTLINGPLEAIEEMDIKDQKLNKNLKVIGQNTKRLLDLTGQLLDFQKIGASKFELKFETVDVTALLNETITRFEPTILQKQKELLQHIPQERIMAAIDKEAITKVLSNLLNNALKYARHTITIDLFQDEADFTVRIVSDGEKIPEASSQQIFEPFYQMEKKDTVRMGVGIGLPLARSLATLHKGRLYLDIEQPENTFVLTIPLNKEEVRQQIEKVVEQNIEVLDEETSTETDQMKGYTLLLVEDNESMRSFIFERLEALFTVETAVNGQEALDILRSNHIDLVISDIMMPVMNGYELCKEIKADIDLCHIPVIFLTAKNDLESKINGLKIGAEAYVEKPFSFNYLKTQILSLLSNRRKEREAFSKRPFFPVHNMQMNKADEEFMNKVINVIQENISDENFNVERMADILCMSRSSLLRKIKILFNLSPIDFIRLIRLKKAAELIQEGKYRIGDICYMVGINSSSYFSKLFLKQFGMTPKEFEKQYQTSKEKVKIDLTGISD